MGEQAKFDRVAYLARLVLIVAAAIITMKWLNDIVIPLSISAFISLSLLPFVQWMERRKINRFLAIFIALLFVTSVISLLIWLTASQINQLIQDLPNLSTRLESFVRDVSSDIAESFGIPFNEQVGYLKQGIERASSLAGQILIGTSNTLSTFIQMPVYIFLLLLYRKKISEFLVSILPVKYDGGETLPKKMKSLVQNYFAGLVLVIAIIAVLNTTGLLILGIRYAIFLGIFSALLTIIPYVGVFVGAALPVIIALITKDSIWYGVGVAGLYAFVQFLEGNFITPRVVGSKVTINALAAILALLVGAHILGIAGMIIAIPSLGILKLIMENTTHLKPIAKLIGE